MRFEFETDKGRVVMEAPDELTPEDVQDLSDWFNILDRSFRRRSALAAASVEESTDE